MNYGFQNEYDFVNLFNNKFLYELDNNSQAFLKEIFENVIDNDEPIKAWKNKMVQKADMFIKYKNYVKSISLKCGKYNSIHHEQLQEFRRYLEKFKIPYDIVDKYVSFHYGYERNLDGKINIDKKLSADEYIQIYQSEIDIFNNYINKTRIIIDMIDRFIIRGRNSDYDIDALISGTVDNYVWINKYDLYDLILSKKCLYLKSPHISCLTIGPKKRDLDGTSNNIRDRYIVRVRWNNITEDIINFKKNIQKVNIK